jgi:hypothetical protein
VGCSPTPFAEKRAEGAFSRVIGAGEKGGAARIRGRTLILSYVNLKHIRSCYTKPYSMN